MRIDPITFEVVNNALVGVAEQMAATILRTSYSTVIREMLDYSTAVFDLEGRIIAQSCRIPIHLNSMSRSLRTTLDEAFPIEDWRPGDIIVTNDPYKGGQHLPDIQTFLPVFSDSVPVAICGTLGHHLDVGGMRPGSYAGDAVEIYQEGLRIPPIKLFEQGKLNERLFAVIAANIRQPDTTMGDLRAQTAALEIGRDGVLELVARYGVETLRGCMDEATSASEARLREKLRELPDGTYEGLYYVDDDGVGDTPIRIVTTVTIEDGAIHVDFTGTERQSRSPINATISSCESATYFAILAILDPTIPANYGVYKPIAITAPEGTVVNALPPAPGRPRTDSTATPRASTTWPTPRSRWWRRPIRCDSGATSFFPTPAARGSIAAASGCGATSSSSTRAARSTHSSTSSRSHPSDCSAAATALPDGFSSTPMTPAAPSFNRRRWISSSGAATSSACRLRAAAPTARSRRATGKRLRAISARRRSRRTLHAVHTATRERRDEDHRIRDDRHRAAGAFLVHVAPAAGTDWPLRGSAARTKVELCHSVCVAPPKVEDGCLEVPDRPGLGVVLDEEKIEKYRIN